MLRGTTQQNLVLSFILLLACSLAGFSQQPALPEFEVENKGSNRIVVSWNNRFGALAQLSVQRSYDGKKFTSVFTAPSPELPVNGYSELAKPGTTAQYRIFYVMPDGKYYFTKAKYPDYAPESKSDQVDDRRDQVNEALVDSLQRALKKQTDDSLAQFLARDYFVINSDTLLEKMTGKRLLQFRDSILTTTKDTLYQITPDSFRLFVFVPPFAQSTSRYVYTNSDGYIVIDLPMADKKRYDLTLMEEDERKLLQMDAIKRKYFVLDKSNFYHGGWYKFELKENGRVLERNRVFLPVDF